MKTASSGYTPSDIGRGISLRTAATINRATTVPLTPEFSRLLSGLKVVSKANVHVYTHLVITISKKEEYSD